MTETSPSGQKQLRTVYFLTQILDTKVYAQEKKIGSLADLVIEENGTLPVVKQLFVRRPFGAPSLLIPLEKVILMSAREIVVDISDTKPYEAEAAPEAILLKDHVLDKKVIDIEDREVDIVYDVKMVYQDGKLYVSDVDMSKYGLLRRIHLKWLGDLIYRPKDRPNKQILSWKYVQPLPSALGSFKGNVQLNILKERLSDIDPVDLADILEELDRGQRAAVFGELETGHASDTLEEIDPSVQRDLVASLKKERVAQLVNEMTPAQAADVLAALPVDQADDILALLDKLDKAAVKKIQSIMQQHQAKIMDYATADFIRFGPETTVAKVEEDFPKATAGKDVITYIYVTDPEGKLLGVADLKDILLADDALLLKDVMDDTIISLSPESTLKQTSRLFRRYNFKALPITDNNGRILGVIPYRDIMNLKHKFLE